MPTLTRIHVTGLLGRFEHEVTFPEDDSFVILHGPNGVGKTHLLSLVYSILSGKFRALMAIRFDAASLEFVDGYRLDVERRVLSDSEVNPIGTHNRKSRLAASVSLKITLLRNGGVIESWNSTDQDQDSSSKLAQRRLLEFEFGFEKVGPDDWFDPRNEAIVSTSEALDQIALLRSDRYPEAVSLFNRVPQTIAEFFESAPAKFVQTQRLLLANDRRTPVNARRPSEKLRQSTVLEFSQDLTRIIASKLAENSRISSQLDRSFPKRVLERKDEPNNDTEGLLQKYHEQTKLRDRLAQVSLVDHATDIPLRDRELNPTERRVLATYLEDAEKSSAHFRKLLRRSHSFAIS